MARSYTKEKLSKMATTLAKTVEVNKVWESKQPDTKEPWVGLEIEFYTFFQHMGRIIANSDIAQYVSLGDDGSIEVNIDDELKDSCYEFNANCYEMKICAPEKKIHEVVGKACSILRHTNARTNSSCGLHIHLDHRPCIGRNPVLTFNNLLKMQNVLFGVSDDREGNEYCSRVDEDADFYQHLFKQMEETGYDGEDSRYYSINLISLRDTSTVEVRIFNGTIKTREVNHFLNLVLGAVKSKMVDKKINEKNVDIVKTIPYSTRNFVKNKMRKVA